MLSPLRFSIDRVTDVEGRPLAEHAAAPEVRAGVDFELAECRFPGSRHLHRKPMNVSALRQMNAHWPAIVVGMQVLRGLYDRDTVRLIDLWRVSELASALPRYLVSRADRPVAANGIPVHVAGMFKVALGLSGAILDLALQALVAQPEKAEAPVDVDELYDFIEREMKLVGPEQVCAGSEAMIRRALRVMCERSPAPPEGASTLALIGDPARFLQFAEAGMSSIVLGGMFGVVGESLYARARAELIEQVEGEGARAALDAVVTGADPSRALLAPLDGATSTMILRQILQVAVAAPQPQGGPFSDAVDAMATCLGESAWPDPAAVADLLGPRASADTIATVSSYLRLERAASTLSTQLKLRALDALGHPPTAVLQDATRAFQPPHRKMRGFLSLFHAVEIDRGRATGADGKVLLLG